jgi:hypothetical protein
MFIPHEQAVDPVGKHRTTATSADFFRNPRLGRYRGIRGVFGREKTSARAGKPEN